MLPRAHMHAPLRGTSLVCAVHGHKRVPAAAARACLLRGGKAGAAAMDAEPPPGGGGGGGGGGGSGAGKGDGEGDNRLRRRGQQSMDVFGGTEGQAVLFVAVLMYVVQQLTTWANSNCSC